MTKQEFSVRLAYLGMTTRELAEEVGVLPNKLSEAMSGSFHTPGRVAMRNKADELTMRKLNDVRADMKAALVARGLSDRVQVILPADNRVLVLDGCELVGFFDPVARRFLPLNGKNEG